MTCFIKTPMINVNDDSSVLTRWNVANGAPVHRGEIIAVLETNKATFDLEAEEVGYLRQFAAEGATLAVGEILGALTGSPDEPVTIPSAEAETASTTEARKLTKKAELVAAKAGLDLSKLRDGIPGTGPITEAEVQAFLSSGAAATAREVKDTVDDAYPQTRQQRLLIVGGGLGAVQLLDSLSRIEHQRAAVIVDDNPSLKGKSAMGVPVLGGRDDIESLYRNGVFDAAVVSVSTSIPFREKMFQLLSDLNIPLANVIDPSARIQRNAVLGTGNVILAYCHIGSCAIVGNGAFLSPYVDIEHHCTVGDYCTFGPGVLMSSLVRIGARVKFGTGVFIEPKLSIGADSIIGSGAILTRDIPANSIVKTKVNYTIRPRG